MRHTFVRPVNKLDTENFVKWSLKTKGNGFDPAAALGPSAFTMCAYNERGPVLYAPNQRPIFMESMAINPDASDLEISFAMKAVIQFLVSQCHIQGINEIYFLASSDETAVFAKKQIFEKVPYDVYRIKVADLERG